MEKNKLPKTYEEACALIGEQPMNEKEMAKILRPDEIARRKLTTIAKALNGPDWEPDWHNRSQAKWRPWFWIKGLLFGGGANNGANGGLAYADSKYAPSDAVAVIGSRLCFKTEALSDYAAETFLDLWDQAFFGDDERYPNNR
jgi:hypothetical protein